MSTTLNIPARAESSTFSRFNIFKRDYANHNGVARINIYLLRLLFSLMFVFLSYESLTYIFLKHKGEWNITHAAAWCMWAGYSVISFIGVIRPLKMLSIVLFEIVYKVLWLMVVAYPLWIKNELAGSAAGEMANTFIWVILPIVAMPWRYFFRTHILGKQTA